MRNIESALAETALRQLLSDVEHSKVCDDILCRDAVCMGVDPEALDYLAKLARDGLAGKAGTPVAHCGKPAGAGAKCNLPAGHGGDFCEWSKARGPGGGPGSDGGPFLRCDACNRGSWAATDYEQFCKMTQPSGRRCEGVLRAQRRPTATKGPR